MDKKYKEIYDIGLSFVVTPHRQVRITELAPGFESPVFPARLEARTHPDLYASVGTHGRSNKTSTGMHTRRGPAAKLGFIGIGDVIIALDEEPIPTDPDADIAAFINARICGPKGSPGLLCSAISQILCITSFYKCVDAFMLTNERKQSCCRC